MGKVTHRNRRYVLEALNHWGALPGAMLSSVYHTPTNTEENLGTVRTDVLYTAAGKCTVSISNTSSVTIRVRSCGLGPTARPRTTEGIGPRSATAPEPNDPHWFDAYLPAGDGVTVTFPGWSHLWVVIESRDPRYASTVRSLILGHWDTLELDNTDFNPRPEDREHAPEKQESIWRRLYRWCCCKLQLPSRRSYSRHHDELESQQGADNASQGGEGGDISAERREVELGEIRADRQEERRSSEQQGEIRADEQEEG